MLRGRSDHMGLHIIASHVTVVARFPLIVHRYGDVAEKCVCHPHSTVWVVTAPSTKAPSTKGSAKARQRVDVPCVCAYPGLALGLLSITKLLVKLSFIKIN